MATGARTARTAAPGTTTADRAHEGARTPAQWYCLVFGATLVLAGLAGFLADATFDTGSDINGNKLIGIFEVNGIHNLIHLASGALLLAASPKRASAKTIAIGFGVVYLLVTIIGFIQGDTVLGLIPINPADNVLHLAISALGIAAGLMSSGDDRERGVTAAADR
jgi:hypothetical protein